MFFKTVADSMALAASLGYEIDPATNDLRRPNLCQQTLRLDIPKSELSRVAIAKRFVSWLGPSSYCLLWVTEYGIWPSSENMHLYYRLRQSYGDFRPLSEAPGHLFISHEIAELETFLWISLLFGWGGFLLKAPLDRHIEFTHDQSLRLYSNTPLALESKEAEDLGLEIA